jgi:hypothetical protein
VVLAERKPSSQTLKAACRADEEEEDKGDVRDMCVIA